MMESNQKVYIGIDPGKTGFISVLDLYGEFSFIPIPKIGNEVDLLSLWNEFKKINNDSDVFCVIEEVHSIYGSSSKSNFEFGRIVGQFESMLVAANIPYAKIQPKKWQKEMWEGIPVQRVKTKTGTKLKTDTKKMSLLAAQRLFPDIDLRKSERAKKPDHNKVDSLLICEYARRKF